MAVQWENNSDFKNERYKPPSWCSQLKVIPETRIKMACLPTPIHRWNVPGVPVKVNIFIKRDDLTGCTLAGNKVRKLEFLLADAVKQGCKHVITAGAIPSNHARATAAAATQLGLKSHLVLSVKPNEKTIASFDMLNLSGNLMLDLMFDSNLYFVPTNPPFGRIMQTIAEQIRNNQKEDSYIIPLGGSCPVGIYGYIECFHELLSQGICDHVTDIVCACGSAGTAEGLAIANHLAGSGLRIHGILIIHNASHFHKHVNSTLQQLGLTEVKSEDILNIIDGYVGVGYGINQQKDLEFIHEVSQKTGIILDPTFTGKAAMGMVTELTNNPEKFKGNNVLFIHTGGIFGGMDGRLDPVISSTQSQARCYMWDKLEESTWKL